MDYLQQGKTLAQSGKFEEALDAFLLAYENDKENADIHFYLGLCYSSLEQFEYAKFHYQIALGLDENHKKTKLVWDSLKNYSPLKPPEDRLTRAAAAKDRKNKTLDKDASHLSGKITKNIQHDYPLGGLSPNVSPQKQTLTDDKWEKAFPIEPSENTKSGLSFWSWIIIILGIAATAALVFWALSEWKSSI